MNAGIKNVLVTGGSRGIGLSIVRRLLDNDFQVTATTRSSPFPDKFTKNKAFTGITCDQEIDEQLTEKLKPLFKGNNPPDVLINNAAIFEDASVSQDDSEWLETWDRTMQINLRSSSLLTKWALNSWVKQSIAGIIINISSRAAYRGDTGEYAAYAASKGGMISFTKSIARSMGKKGITAFSIAPGFVNTEMASNSIAVYGEEYLTQDSVFGDIIPPEEIAELALFLASGSLKHASGSTFHINGGSYMI